MARTVSIGTQDFETLRKKNCFYVDKTDLIREWWESEDAVTLITRPRRFGKTLNMSMLECFFSNKYEGRGELFEGLSIWEDEKYRELQGTYPVIFLTFAEVKFRDYETTRRAINSIIEKQYYMYRQIMLDECFDDTDREKYRSVCKNMDDETAADSINMLCSFLERKYGRKCIVLLDEYDTPMQESYLNGFWEELSAYFRTLFGSTFKTNTHLERAVMTGITRVSKESIFSDFNNLKVVTTTSAKYATAFGFTEKEVFRAMKEQGVDPALREEIKLWYDGFTFGGVPDIYNPWSITSFLDEGKIGIYWANTSSNGLVGLLLQKADKRIKMDFEQLLDGGYIETEIDEQIIFNQLFKNKNAVWSLLLAAGYLKVVSVEAGWGMDRSQEQESSEGWQMSKMRLPLYRLALTNLEVRIMFRNLILGWFGEDDSFGSFVNAMFTGNVREMNHYMNEVALNTFSYFDAGNKPSGRKEPERFYHGFVLGLLVDKAGSYIVKSNRESGLGRYDVVMEPKDIGDVAVIMEFKVFDKEDNEATLEDTARNALRQIAEKKYETDLLQRGIPAERIYQYGFAFKGERCLIRKAFP